MQSGWRAGNWEAASLVSSKFIAGLVVKYDPTCVQLSNQDSAPLKSYADGRAVR